MKLLVRLAPLLLLSGSVFGQTQLVTFDGTTETPVGAVYNTGTTAVGDASETRFRLRNTGVAAVTIQKIAIAGAGFTLSSVPSLPYIVAPANFLEFRVRFAPQSAGSYSANLAVDSINVIVLGAANAAPALTLSQNGSAAPLAAGSTIDFGRVQFGQSSSLAFTISNTSAVTASIDSIAVTGAAFKGPVGLTAPVTLAPGASASFQIVFQPPAASVQQGALTIGQRAFQLSGTGFNPPAPPASIVFDNGPNASAQQRSVSVHFDSASQVAGNGTLTLAFKPAVQAVADDAAVQFVSTGSRNATLSFAAGDTAAKLNGQTSLTFQTGTTAGDLTFTLTIGSQVVQATVTVPPAAVSIANAVADSRVGDLDITITGFDNTYSVSTMSFLFYDRSGKAIGSSIAVDATANFRSYFATTKAGGSFLMRATFPVAGDATQIGAVDIGINNSAGVSSTQHVMFP